MHVNKEITIIVEIIRCEKIRYDGLIKSFDKTYIPKYKIIN